MKIFQVREELINRLRSLLDSKLLFYPRGSGSPSEWKICFISGASDSGAVYLRQGQLSEMASKVVETYWAEDASQIQDNSVVIGSKGSWPILAKLRSTCRQANVKFLFDPVDQLLDPKILSGIDGIIASSYRQYVWLRKSCSLPVFLLPHHADLRISAQVQPMDGFRLGYFGAKKNAFLTERLALEMDVIETGTPQSVQWMDELEHYPCHYCVRRKPDKGGTFKPATKIYIAAKVGAAVITTRDESDAELLLPPDYPFFCDSRSEDSILEVIQFARESFGTPVFEKALADVAKIQGWSEADQRMQLNTMLSLC